MKAHTLNSPSAPVQTRWQRFVARRLPTVVIGMMVTALMVAVIYPHVVITVPTGHVGVLWKRLGGFGVYCWCVVNRGTVLEPQELRDEGLHIIWPWDKLYFYDLRLQTATQTYNAISKDGVSLTATINMRFQLKHNSVAQLHKFIGPDYMELVVRPEIGSRARETLSKYTAEEVYSTSRQAIEDTIRESAQTKLGMQLDRLVQPEASDQFQAQYQKPVLPELRHAIDILDTLVLGISLPEAVMTAINRKIEQLYVAQEYEFRVIREGRESERKRVEAAGIRDFQQIVSQGISDSYLRWRGIEATLQLAQSANAKTVIIGSNKDGLPIILGNADAPAPSPAPSDGGASPTRMTTPPPVVSATPPAGGVAWPSEHTPSTNPTSMNTPSTNPAPLSSAVPRQPQSAFPHSWSDLQGMLFQTPHPEGPATAKPDQPPAEPAR
jgi:regulator of protease activity HflC (stomatin/prohibitin superfamily)